MKNNIKWAAEYLPAHYDLYERIDLTRDKKAFNSVCIWSVVALVLLIIYGLFRHPFLASFDMEFGRIAFCLGASAVGMLVYIVLHEGVHGIFIRLFTGEAPTFGVELKKGMAYAGSDYFFRKWPYIIIALAPVVVWGIVLGVWLLDVPEQYFWYIYMVQIFNLTGAAGDFYVTCRTLMMPGDILAKDTGTAMDFYRPTM